MTGRPPARFESTTRAGSPSTSRSAPTASRSGVSLAFSTTKAPSRPCGRPTRPIATSSVTDEALEVLGRLPARGLGVLVAAERGRVVLGAPELDLGAEERPVGARLVLVRHADAAGVHPADGADPAVVLHVRMTRDDGVGAHVREDSGEPRLRREGRDHVDVVLRRGMAEEDVSQPVDVELHVLGEAVDEVDLLVAQLGAARLLEQLALGVAAEPARAVAQAAE